MTGFIADFLAWFPFHYMIDFNNGHLLKSIFILKIIRLYEGYILFNVTKIMQTVKKNYHQMIVNKLEKSPNLE